MAGEIYYHHQDNPSTLDYGFDIVSENGYSSHDGYGPADGYGLEGGFGSENGYGSENGDPSLNTYIYGIPDGYTEGT